MRDYQLARELARHHSVTFVEMRASQDAPQTPPPESGFDSVVSLEKRRPYSFVKIVLGLAGPTPVTVLNCWSRQAASQLAELFRSDSFDSVQMEGVHLSEYLPTIQNAPKSPAVVIDWHNIESELMRRYAQTTSSWPKKLVAKRTATLLELAECGLLDSRATHTVTSERERDKLLDRCPEANLRVIPNGVDAGYYSETEIAKACRKSVGHNSKPTILFAGSMDYHANVDAVTWFARTAWPAIAEAHPDLQFTIVGRDPAPEVRALASDRIRVTGTVDDVRPYYASALAAVVPLRCGSGTRLKILESMAAGVPVISTRLGAEGIDAQDKVHLLLADRAQQITDAVHSVTLSTDLRNRVSRAARALVWRMYDWSIIGKKLCALHEDLAPARAPRSLRKVS
jgi:glycosyltransferase involved in cell wall biosynthesis